MTAMAADCLIVGGGPAGLTAAIYAARFRLTTVVVDAGGGRAAQIPRTRNHAGFPGGISGEALLDRMRTQAVSFGVDLRAGRVDAIGGSAGDFTAWLTQGEPVRTRAVILATGVSNHRPEIGEAAHAQALARGLLRYCPVCDGYEVTDRNVGVIGAGAHAVREASFLRAYTDRVTVIGPTAAPAFGAAQRAELAALGITVADGPASDIRVEATAISLEAAGRRLWFDTVYPALGSTVHSALAAGLGASLTADGCIRVDTHQRTSVPGVYAAGDVVIGLDQISHAMGEAGVAATTLRNDLAAATPQLRGPAAA
ncbi:NAD(P)/FAD-dependent oxidoreductase [Caulobacter sp. KR2-114]|uniref:NAD(P)/FAD-dependent oxidoreductase n=1 Tax=Caulobacter sp. KR2-114 TaxID=3400912 RepID=UPI003C12AC3F